MESFTLSFSCMRYNTVLAAMTQYKYIFFRLMGDDCRLNPTLLPSYLNILTCVVFSITGYVSCFHKTQAVNMSKLKLTLTINRKSFICTHKLDNCFVTSVTIQPYFLLKAKYLLYLNKLQSLSNVCLVFIFLYFVLQSIEFNNAVILISVIKLHFFTRPDTHNFLSCWIFCIEKKPNKNFNNLIRFTLFGLLRAHCIYISALQCSR